MTDSDKDAASELSALSFSEPIRTVLDALEVANELAKEGISVEVIDLRTQRDQAVRILTGVDE